MLIVSSTFSRAPKSVAVLCGTRVYVASTCRLFQTIFHIHTFKRVNTYVHTVFMEHLAASKLQSTASLASCIWTTYYTIKRYGFRNR